jgi:branched-chain amino acid transport system permease protein
VNSIWIDVLDRALMFAMLAVGANLVLGIAGQMSLAMAAFFGIGAYTAAISASDHGWGFAASTLLAVAASAAIGAVLALPVLRVRGEYVVLLTLAFLSVVNQMESSWIDLTGGATGKFPIPGPSIFGWKPRTPAQYVPLLLAMFAIVLVVAVAVARSPYGRVLKGIREDPVAMQALGAHVFRYQVSVFALSGAIAGLVGSLWAHYFAFITPGAFDLTQTIFIAAIVVLGGMGNVWGSVVAALVLVSLPQMLKSLHLSANKGALWQQVVYGALLVAFMIFRPQGLLPERVSPRRSELWGGDDHGPTGGPAALRPTVDGTHPVLLSAEHLSKSFGGVRALDDVSIDLRAGRITALIGPNGAGKTTLFNVLTGDLRADKGRVVCRGRDITGKRSDQIVRIGVARSFQDVRVFSAMNAVDNVAAGMRDQPGLSLSSVLFHPLAIRRGRRTTTRQAHELLDEVGMTARRDVAAGELGYGEQKLVALARLLAADPDVVLLDEPSSGTDAKWVTRVLEIIRRLADDGKAVCIVEHNLDLIRQLDGFAYFLDEGRIVAQGSVEDLMRRSELLETYLGVS